MDYVFHERAFCRDYSDFEDSSRDVPVVYDEFFGFAYGYWQKFAITYFGLVA